MSCIITRIKEMLRNKCNNPLQNKTGNVCINVALRQFHVTVIDEEKQRV